MFTLNTLTLLILLTFLHLAFSEALSKSKCKKPFPSIAIRTNNSFYNSLFDKRKRITMRYGDSIKVMCSGNVTRLAMAKDGGKILTQINDLSIYAIVIPDRPISKFVCSDSVTGCERSVIIFIEQVIKVMSRNIEIVNKNRTCTSTIHYGRSFEVICSGTGRFVMTKNGHRLLTEQNGTTIKWFEIKPELQSSEFICSDIDTSFNTSVMIKVTPLMSIRAGNETVKVKYHQGDTPVYPVTYGDNFEVFCFGNTFKKILVENKEITEYINETTAKGFIAKFDKIELILNCISGDCVSSIKVVSKPRIDVTSASHTMRIGKLYVIKYGDQVDILCSAPTTKKLKMAHHHDFTNVKKLTFITVNETTIKYVIDKPDILVNAGHNMYACLIGKVLSRVDIELLPEVENFQCVSYIRRYLNCTWVSLNHISNMTLSYIDNGISTSICVQTIIVPGFVFYVWHRDQYPTGYKTNMAEFTFVLQSCNYFGCFNQTFVVDHLSTVKINAPRRLTVNSTTTRTVRLRWGATYERFRGERFTTSNGGIAHKVEYWYSGIQPLEANSSLITCSSFYCEIELKLPCPGQLYEVWIYEKLSRVGDEFWSEPSFITFYTDFDDKTHIVDESCPQRPRKTKEVMIYFVQTLREHVRLEMRRLKDKLRYKRDKIRAYLDRD